MVGGSNEQRITNLCSLRSQHGLRTLACVWACMYGFLTHGLDQLCTIFFLFGSVTRAQTTDLSWTEREDASADVFAHTLPGRTLAAKCHATTYH